MITFLIMLYLAFSIIWSILTILALSNKEIMEDDDSVQGIVFLVVVFSLLWSVYFTYLI